MGAEGSGYSLRPSHARNTRGLSDMSDSAKPSRRRILVTSALPYSNGPIHLGKLLEDMQADAWVRFQRMRGHDCTFVCADDAHGTATMLAAEELGVTPEELIEQLRQVHERDFRSFRVAHDNYYTTHSEENRALTEMLYLRCRDAGAISTRQVDQLYDPEKQMFLADRLVRGTCPRCGAEDQPGDNCDNCSATYDAMELKHPRSAISGAVPEVRSSLHYFFELGQFETFLRAWTRSGTLQRDVVNKLSEWLDAGLRPWDISRDAPYFGLEIPDTEDKYFYVWMDAPIGYLATFENLFAREGGKERIEDYLAPDTDVELHHFIGKDIINFHGLFWPAVLHCAGARTPTKIHTHGFITVGGEKMSKSRGTFILASTYAEHLDADYLRYYFATKLSPSMADMDINLDDFVQRVNSDLVGKVVNIASRCAGFINRGYAGALSNSCHDEALWQDFVDAGERIAQMYEDDEFSKLVREISALADKANQYIAHHEPWTLAKQPGKEQAVQDICTMGLNLFRVLMVYLKPIVPGMVERAEALFGGAELTWDDHARFLKDARIEKFETLLARIDKKAVDRLVEASREDVEPGGTTPAEATTQAQIDYDEFAKIDLRVARIVKAEHVEGADKLLRLTLDLDGDVRQVFAGIKEAYEPAKLEGRLTVVVANLEPREMRFGVSEGMVLAAGPGGEEIFLISPDDGAKPGMEVR